MLTSSTVIVGAVDYERRVQVEDDNNNKILSLTLHNSSDTHEFLDTSMRTKYIELLAFAKGWSTWLGDDFVKGEDGYGTGLHGQVPLSTDHNK
jgi:hypothetical protein